MCRGGGSSQQHNGGYGQAGYLDQVGARNWSEDHTFQTLKSRTIPIQVLCSPCMTSSCVLSTCQLVPDRVSCLPTLPEKRNLCCCPRALGEGQYRGRNDQVLRSLADTICTRINHSRQLEPPNRTIKNIWTKHKRGRE